MSSDDLEILIDRMALGQQAAFTTLYGRTCAKLFGVCLRILKNQHDAEEAVQDAYIKIWNNAGRFRTGGARPMSWLIAIARNHCIDLLRKTKPMTRELDAAAEVASSDPSPEAIAISAQERRKIDICLAELEVSKAKAIRWAYLEGYSYAELALSFDVPLNTMRTWLRRSLISLRECMTR